MKKFVVSSNAMLIHRCSLTVVLMSLVPGGCSSSGTGGPDPEVLRLAGTYSTAVGLTENSCGSGITVQALATVVGHAPAASTLTLQHGPLTHTGTVTTAGAFTTQPNVFQDAASGAQSTLTISGLFNTTGFTGDVTVDVAQNVAPTTCRYKVRWVGTRQSGVNTFP